MKFWLFLLFLGFRFLMLAQEDEKLNWTEQLSWVDFKAAPKKDLPFKANTNSGMSFSWETVRKNNQIILNFDVRSNFYPNRSWVKEIEEGNYLLAHEQLHFDITELHARKLRKALENFEPGKKIKKDLNAIYSEIERQRRQMQDQFDKETNHSINKEVEYQWRHFVRQELDKLSEFSS